jgi:hypothetical protein
MKFSEALDLAVYQHRRISRSSWKGEYVMAVYPSEHPGVVGDASEFLVFNGLHRIAGPFPTRDDAKVFIDDRKKVLVSLWERFNKYQDLVKVRAATPLDFAVKPDMTLEAADEMEIHEVPRMSSKRVTHPFLAVQTSKGKTFVPWTPDHEDLFAEDWKTT